MKHVFSAPFLFDNLGVFEESNFPSSSYFIVLLISKPSNSLLRNESKTAEIVHFLIVAPNFSTPSSMDASPINSILSASNR